MKLWLYSHLKDSPGNQLVEQESKRRGWHFRRLRPGEQHFDLAGIQGERPDLVLTRVGSSAPNSAIYEVAILEQLGLRCVNGHQGLLVSRDKALSAAAFSHHGVPTPRAALLGERGVDELLEIIPGPPWVIKLTLGTKGQGVAVADSLRSLRSTVDALRTTEVPLLLQEFVSTAHGADTRVVVLGGKAAVAAQRQAVVKDEFRSNVALGGSAKEIELLPAWADIAERAVACLGLEIAGVDMVQGPEGPLVLEVNGSPGLTAAPHLTSLLLDYLESKL